MAHLLSAESISLEFPAKKLFLNVTVGLAGGDRIGVVGRNGDGKSTLLSILSQRLKPDLGTVSLRKGVTIGVLDQGDALDPSLTVSDHVIGTRMTHEWAANYVTREIVTNLVKDIPLTERIGNLSGGERRRVALAKLLTGDWDVLALDEPTNHLDVEGVAWLAKHLRSRWGKNEGALIVVTHDRWFLDEVSTSTWEVFGGAVEQFEGGYSAYVLKKVERDRRLDLAEVRRQNLMRKELAWLRRGPPARTAKPKFRIDAANAIIAQEPKARDSVQLKAMSVSRLGRDVIETKNMSFDYELKTIIRNLNFNVGPGDRIGILGSNGAGKSTLLELLSGDLAPTSGEVKIGSTVISSRLSQSDSVLMEYGDLRLYEVMAKHKKTFVSGGQEVGSGQLLERLGFSAIDMSSLIREFSGGQRRRLQLLLALLEEPNVLILDEPTNDMDVEMLVAIEDLLDTWVGTLLIVSHDRYLIERTVDLVYGLVDGNLVHLPRGIDQFLAITESAQNGNANNSTNGDEQRDSAKDLRVAKTIAPKIKSRSLKEVNAVERKLKRTEQELTKANALLQDHDFNDYRGLASLGELIQELEQQVRDLEEHWLTLTMEND